MWEKDFLTRLELGDPPATAARNAGTTMKEVNALRNQHPRFNELVEEAMALKVDKVEQAAYERAVNGVPKGVYHKGELVATETVYSDGLLTKLLEAYRPEQFTPNQRVQQLTAIEVVVRNFDELTTDKPLQITQWADLV